MIQALLQDQLVELQISDNLLEPFVLFLQPLQFFELLYAHSTVLLLPPVLDLFSHTDLSDCINQRRALPCQNFDLP